MSAIAGSEGRVPACEHIITREDIDELLVREQISYCFPHRELPWSTCLFRGNQRRAAHISQDGSVCEQVMNGNNQR